MAKKSELREWAEHYGFAAEIELIEAAERVKRQMKRVSSGMAGDALVERHSLKDAAEKYAGVRDCNACETVNYMGKVYEDRLQELINKAFRATEFLSLADQQTFSRMFGETRTDKC